MANKQRSLEHFNDEELRAELQRRVDLMVSSSPQPTDEATDLSGLPPGAWGQQTATAPAGDRTLADEYQGIMRLGLARIREFPTTRNLVDDAVERVPRLRQLSDQELATFLKDWDCIHDRNSRVRGWKFPPLGELRAKWVRRYPGWEWDNPELQDWE